ncbi:MAG: hypothetical protein ACLUR9_07390 [Christensenellales bacterium]
MLASITPAPAAHAYAIVFFPPFLIIFSVSYPPALCNARVFIASPFPRFSPLPALLFPSCPHFLSSPFPLPPRAGCLYPRLAFFHSLSRRFCNARLFPFIFLPAVCLSRCLFPLFVLLFSRPPLSFKYFSLPAVLFFHFLFRPSLLFYLSYAFAPSVRFNHRRAAPFFCPFSSHIRPISSVFCLVPFLFNPPGRLSPRFPVVFSPAAFAAFSFVFLFFLRILFARAAPFSPFVSY